MTTATTTATNTAPTATTTATSETPLLQVRNLCKHFPIMSKGFARKQIGAVKAVDQVNFDLYRGETLGIVGESGSGKTTCARTILRALAPTSGQALFHADGLTVDLATLPEKELKPLRQKMQMVFQDPFSSLNPRMTVGDIVAEPLVIHNLAKGKELEDRVVDMLVKVGLKPEHRQRYPHAFSGGQRQRIGIARALIMQPSLVVADEAVSALDVSVQAQVINLLADLQEEFNLTYIFVAHDLSVVQHICDRVAVMYAGKIVELATSEELFQHPRHPYTRALLSAVPNVDPDVKINFGVGGEVADAGRLPPGCSFHPRCPNRFDPCDKVVPPLDPPQATPRALEPPVDGSACRVACHLYFSEPKIVNAGAQQSPDATSPRPPAP
jgi:peptide/nickel transport system ATP-binding protein